MMHTKEKKNAPILLYLESFMISTLVCFTCYLTLRLKYETNDDTYMNLIAAGAFGKESQYLLWMNICYGFLLRFLYMLLPFVNWYLLLLLGISIISVATISYFLAENTSTWGAACITFAINLLLMHDLYVEINFTKAAGICTIASGMLLLKGLKSAKLRFSVVGTVLILLAISIRYVCALMLLPYMLIYICYMGVGGQLYLKDKKIWIRIAIPLFSVSLLLGADTIAYNNGIWKDVKPTLSELSKIVDYGMIHYDAKPREFSNIGMTKEISDMVNHVIVGDEQIITKSLLADSYRIEKEISGNRLELTETAYVKVGDRLQIAFREHYLPSIVLMLIVLVVLVASTGQVILIGGTLCLLLGEYWYLSCRGRVLWRVEFSIWVVAFVVLWYILKARYENYEMQIKDFSKKRKLTIAGIMAILVLTTGAYMYGQWLSKDRYVTWNQDSAEAFIRSISGTEQFYVGLELDPVPNIYKITKTNYQNYFSNYGIIGSWMSRMPNVKQVSMIKGRENPVRALVESEQTYFVGTEEEALRMVAYLQSIYQLPIGITDTYEINGRVVFTIRKL